RFVVDAARFGPGRLLQFEPAVFDIQFVALALQLRKLHEQRAALMARPHDRDRADHRGNEQKQQTEDAYGLHALLSCATFCATRSTAERARGLAACSASEGNCALPTAASLAGAAATGGPRRLPCTRP